MLFILTWIITPSAFADRSPVVVVVVVVIGVVDIVVVAVAIRRRTGRRAQMFLVSRSHVLEPNLRHSLGQSRQIGDALQVLAVRVRVQQEIGLQNVKLLLCECGPHSFRFRSASSFRISFFKEENKIKFFFVNFYKF